MVSRQIEVVNLRGVLDGVQNLINRSGLDAFSVKKIASNQHNPNIVIVGVFCQTDKCLDKFCITGSCLLICHVRA